MKSSQVIQFCAKLGAKLDTHLFDKKEEDKTRSPLGTAVVGGAVIGGAALGTSKAVDNRLGGLRATVPGFAGRSTIAQRVIATGSVVKDATVAAPGKVAAAAAGAASGVKSAASRTAGAYSNARNIAGMGVLPSAGRALKKGANPLLSGLKRIAKIGAK